MPGRTAPADGGATERADREPSPATALSKDDWLPTTAYALLGLMSFGEEFTGYQLERRAAVSLRHFFWSPAMSQIYTELRRLEELGPGQSSRTDVR